MRAVLAVLLVSLVWPAVVSADHVTAEPFVSARVKELRPGSALVEVSWLIVCHGSGAEGTYGGNLNLVDEDTGDETYLGGVFSASGTAGQLVERRAEDRRMRPQLTAQCSRYDANGTLHGSDTIEVSGDPVVIPRKGGGGGGGPGGGGGDGGGNGGGGSGGADPGDPLQPGGCAIELLGTAGPDLLDGGAGGDLILALGGADRVRGGDGHDCLLGGPGRDRLLGEDGRDRLTAGSGADRLDGGEGRNAYDAGSGNDRVRARNGLRETVRCGAGFDIVRADRSDRLRGCEHAARPG